MRYLLHSRAYAPPTLKQIPVVLVMQGGEGAALPPFPCPNAYIPGTYTGITTKRRRPACPPVSRSASGPPPPPSPVFV